MTAILCLAICLAQADQPKGAEKDLAGLQGTWSFTTKTVRTVNGVPMAILRESRLVIKGVGFQALKKEPDGSFQEDFRGTIELDVKARPRAIDLVRADGATMLGIYELDGKSWRLALSEGNAPRPKEFGKQTVILTKID